MKSGRRSKAETKTRAVDVYGQLVRGFHPQEIATGLGMREDHVWWYLREAGRILEGNFAQLTKDGVLNQMWLEHRERRRQLWLMQQTAQLEVVRVAALKQLLEEDRRLEELMIRLGLFEPAPPPTMKHDITLTERRNTRIRIEVAYADPELTERFAHLVSGLR